uniref:Uncharacterized protein n=1 Tax=Porcine respiratory coronavirus TaxID=11146 RepID=A0A2U8Z8X4_TGEV|nr:hypothetical protein [Porcine respiratory coronavirus]
MNKVLKTGPLWTLPNPLTHTWTLYLTNLIVHTSLLLLK